MQVDRQRLLFFIIMFIFVTLPSGNDQPHSTKEKNTLVKFQRQLKASHQELQNSTYTSGYGNITGFHLSYNDMVDGLNASQWPIHDYNDAHPWSEDEQWSVLPNAVSDRVKQFWSLPDSSGDSKSYPLNISGRSYGEFEALSSDITPFMLKPPRYLREYYEYSSQEKYQQDKERYENDPEHNQPPQDIEYSNPDFIREGNFTKSKGKISLIMKASDYNYKLEEYKKSIDDTSGIHAKVDDAVVVRVNLNLVDYDEITSFELETRGVYFQETGALVTTTASAKFLGEHALPHLTMNPKNFAKSQALMSQFLNITDVEHELDMDEMNGYLINSYEKCEFISYFQLEKTDYTHDQLRLIDQELRVPSGIPIPHLDKLPELVVKDYLIYSPDCGKIFTSKPKTRFAGAKSEVLNLRIKNVLVGLLVIVCAQLCLFLRQIKKIQTPSQRSTISTKTLFILGFQDALLSLMFLLISTLVDDLYLILASLAIVAFIMCGIFEMRFMVTVMTTQANERGTSWWEILRGGRTASSEEAAENTVNDPNNLLPLANNPPPAPAAAAAAAPAPGPEPQWGESNFSNSVFTVGFTVTIIATFLVLNSLTWRVTYRRVFEYIGLLFLSSYWLPQFLRNTLKNRRKSFSWEFVYGTTVLRVLPIYYFTLVKSNPLRHHYEPNLSILVTIWLGIQILLLHLQNSMGSRFWVNEKWLPTAYDYQPLLQIKDLENGGFASDLLAGIKPEEEINGIINCKSTCSICMTDIDLPILADGGSKETRKKINTKEYMVTPCHHIFHSECLDSWMKYKLQCPVCRENLPPV